MTRVPMHHYPYRVKTFVSNSKQYGKRAALSEDWYMTKKNASDLAWGLAGYALIGTALAILVPVGIYQISRGRHKTQ